MLEIVCVLAIIGLLAALTLPRLSNGTSRSRLHAYAIETASMLMSDRSAAVRRHARISTGVDAKGRAIRSGATGRLLRIPDDVVVDAVLPVLCGDRRAISTIDFLPSGMSCGGTIALTRGRSGYGVRVNWLTGGVEVVPHDTP